MKIFFKEHILQIKFKKIINLILINLNLILILYLLNTHFNKHKIIY